MLPLPRQKKHDNHQKHPGACGGRSVADAPEAPAQCNAEKVANRHPEQHRGDDRVYQGEKGMSAADEKTVNAEDKRDKKEIPGKRAEVSNAVTDHQGIAAEKAKN